MLVSMFASYVLAQTSSKDAIVQSSILHHILRHIYGESDEDSLDDAFCYMVALLR